MVGGGAGSSAVARPTIKAAGDHGTPALGNGPALGARVDSSVGIGPTTFSLRGGRSPSHLPSSGVIRCKEPVSGARIFISIGQLAPRMAPRRRYYSRARGSLRPTIRGGLHRRLVRNSGWMHRRLGWGSATGPSCNGAGFCPNTRPPPARSTGYSTAPTSSSPTATPTACARPGPGTEVTPRTADQPEGGDIFNWPPAGTTTRPLTALMAWGHSWGRLESIALAEGVGNGHDVNSASPK